MSMCTDIYYMPQCLSYTPILIPTAVLWLSTNFPPNVVCADLAMCEAAKALQALLLQVGCLQVSSACCTVYPQS